MIEHARRTSAAVSAVAIRPAPNLSIPSASGIAGVTMQGVPSASASATLSPKSLEA